MSRANKSKSIDPAELYVFDLDKNFALSPFSSGGAALTISNLKALEAQNAEEDVDKHSDEPTCKYCGIIPKDLSNPNYIRDHYRRDYHRYNIKRSLHNQSPLTEDEFEKLIGELDESISGSDSSESEGSDSEDADKVQKLLRKTHLNSIPEGNGLDEAENFEDSDNTTSSKNTPYFLYSSPNKLPEEKVLAVYKSVFDPKYISPPEDSELSKLSDTERIMEAIGNLNHSGTSCILMIGGGHFSGAIIAHAVIPKQPSTPTNPYANVHIIASKSFHRYTTRRKQGGSQSASDNARGKANSAGSSLRRYNEAALEKEVRELLREWAKPYLSTVDSIYIRANGKANRAVLMNYKEAPIVSSDPRIKGLPFTTKRATATEIKRSWWELTHAKVIDKPVHTASTKSDSAAKHTQKKALTKDEEKLEAHSKELSQLIRRSKVPSLIAYLKKNKLSAVDFRFFPANNQEYQQAPTLLHYASIRGIPAVVTSLLRTLGADPTALNENGKTAFQVVDDRPTRDAFQLARGVMGEKDLSADSKVSWDWTKDARVGPALTKEEVKARDLKEKKEKDAQNEANRSILMEVQQKEIEKLKKEAAKKLASGRTLGEGSASGSGNMFGRNVGGGPVNSKGVASLSATNANVLGMTPEERKKFEREQRARAIEARLGLNKKK